MLFRRELAAFLDEFAEHHRGVRRGRMFGLPAIYAGRRLVSCLYEDGLIVRLPDAVARQEVRAGRGTPFSRRGRALGSWVMYRPESAAAARVLTPLLETAARHLAIRQTEALTGVPLSRSKR